MITVNFKTGEINCSGSLDDILMEYTMLTKVVHQNLSDNFTKEESFNVIAKLGQIAVEAAGKPFDVVDMYNKLDTVLKDELKI